MQSSNLILVALLACGIVFMNIYNKPVENSLETHQVLENNLQEFQTIEQAGIQEESQKLEAQTGNFNFWAGNFYCNAQSGCSQGNNGLVTYSYSNSSMITSLSSVLRQFNATTQYYSWDSQNGGLYRPQYPNYGCSYNMTYNYAILCQKQY